jgi:hypothetical protein
METSSNLDGRELKPLEIAELSFYIDAGNSYFV